MGKPKNNPTLGEEDEELFCICRSPDDGEPMIGCDYCDEWCHYTCVGLKDTDVDLIESFACPKCKEGGKQTLWEPVCRLPACNFKVSKGSFYCTAQHGQEFFRFVLDHMQRRDQAVALVRYLTPDNYKTLGKEKPKAADDKVEQAEKQKEEENGRKIAMLQREREDWETFGLYLVLLQDRLKRISEEDARRAQQEEEEASEAATNSGGGSNSNNKRRKKNNSAKAKAARRNRMNQICGMNHTAMNQDWQAIYACVKSNSVEEQELCRELKRKCPRHADWMKITELESSHNIKRIDKHIVKLRQLQAQDSETRLRQDVARMQHYTVE